MPPRDVNAEHEVDQEAMHRRYLERQRRANYGFQELERLAGNGALEGIEAERNPMALEASKLEAFAGVYGPRKIRIEDGSLVYQRDEGPVYRLVPMGTDRFRIVELDYFRIRFERDGSGAVTTLVGLYNNGREEPSPRSGG